MAQINRDGFLVISSSKILRGFLGDDYQRIKDGYYDYCKFVKEVICVNKNSDIVFIVNYDTQENETAYNFNNLLRDLLSINDNRKSLVIIGRTNEPKINILKSNDIKPEDVSFIIEHKESDSKNYDAHGYRGYCIVTELQSASEPTISQLKNFSLTEWINTGG